MAQEPEKTQERSPVRHSTANQLAKAKSGWVPAVIGTWKEWLTPFHSRLAMLKKWHQGHFPRPVSSGQAGCMQVAKKIRPPKSRRRGDAEKNRVREWVSSMVDLRVRWLAFCLFLDPAGVNKGLLEMAGVLGVSPAWVGEKIGVLLEERFLLARGDNHAGELSA